MKQSIILIVLIVLSYCSYGMIEVTSFGDNPGNLKMFVHVPTNLKPNAPMVIALHGCNQNAEDISIETGWNKLADDNGFIVLYPQQRYSNNGSRCFNWFLSKDTESGSGETASIISMIEYMKSNYSIDSEQLNIYGLSAGAALATNILATYPDVFNAGASLAGGPIGFANNAIRGLKMMRNCPDLSTQEWRAYLPNVKSEYVPMLIVVHGQLDNVVDPVNAVELVDQWKGMYKEGVEFTFKEETLGVNVKRKSYSITENDNPFIVHYDISDIGHAVPINPGSGLNEGGRDTGYTKDVNFFSTYYIAEDFGLIP